MQAFWAKAGEAFRVGTLSQTPPPVEQGVPLPAARLRTLLGDTPRKLTADRVLV
ncbi:hypothetical protein E4N62_43310 [Streptomyces sp. MNU76]|uniref:hypothetical protein n=1 Tax=Streptomyces sp. MNU76 TaxID=2560026 RepID=UPI001E40ACF4|nr:hypothetical protein [Streptomyces sp. MNU76]MCC9711455.1 hypothetical protein [Streptomyces sp. MNU76]